MYKKELLKKKRRRKKKKKKITDMIVQGLYVDQNESSSLHADGPGFF